MAKKTDGVKKTEKIKAPKHMKITIAKYLQLHGSEIHKYTKAYLEVQFRGIIKTTEAWKEEINKVMEGDK
jgi:hypothetical protein